MIDFIAKLEGMLKTSGCEDYEIQYLPRGQAFCLTLDGKTIFMKKIVNNGRNSVLIILGKKPRL